MKAVLVSTLMLIRTSVTGGGDELLRMWQLISGWMGFQHYSWALVRPLVLGSLPNLQEYFNDDFFTGTLELLYRRSRHDATMLLIQLLVTYP